jgi:tight adherence protein C
MSDLLTFCFSFLVSCAVLIYWPKMSEKGWLQRRLFTLRDKTLLEWQEEKDKDPLWLEQFFIRILALFRNLNSLEITKWKNFLALAGWRSKRSFAIFLTTKVLCAAGLVFINFVSSILTSLLRHDPELSSLLLILSGFVGFRLPNIFVEIVAKKRQQTIEKGIPDLLDMMVICTEAGLGLDTTLSRVARSIATLNPPIAEHLNLLIIELMFTADRRQALLNLYNRTQIKALHVLATTFIQSERYGTALSQALSTLATETRHHRILAAEARAARLPATLTIPLIVLILPCLFIVILGPVIITL